MKKKLFNKKGTGDKIKIKFVSKSIKIKTKTKFYTT